jgi:hypothetical protein
MHSVSAVSDDRDMKPLIQHRHHSKPLFAVVPPVVLD